MKRHRRGNGIRTTVPRVLLGRLSSKSSDPRGDIIVMQRVRSSNTEQQKTQADNLIAYAVEHAYRPDDSEPARTPAPVPEWVPMPLNTLPPVVRDFAIEAARSIGVDVAYVALPALVVAMSLIGNSCRLRLKRKWRIPCNAWLALVGESGSGKSPALAMVKSLLHEMVRRYDEKYGCEHAEWERKSEAYKEAKRTNRNRTPTRTGGEVQTPGNKPTRKRLYAVDTTVERAAKIHRENPKGILLLYDELRTLFGGFDRYRAYVYKSLV